MFEGFRYLNWKSFGLGLATPIVLTGAIFFVGIVWSFFEYANLSFAEHLSTGIKTIWYYYVFAMLFSPVFGYYFLAPYGAGEKLERMEKNFLHGCGYIISAVTIFLLFVKFVNP